MKRWPFAFAGETPLRAGVAVQHWLGSYKIADMSIGLTTQTNPANRTLQRPIVSTVGHFLEHIYTDVCTLGFDFLGTPLNFCIVLDVWKSEAFIFLFFSFLKQGISSRGQCV